MTDILIIGAGAAGLMAGRELAAAGRSVTILEARNRTGGRIHTLQGSPFTIELGAEFLHGEAPVTKALLQEAGIPFHPVNGSMWQAKDGRLEKEAMIIEHWDLFAERLKALQEDISLHDFLDQYFPGDGFAVLRQSVINFASGYDTADPAQASALAMRKEWLEEDEMTQYRPEQGYGRMIHYLQSSFAGVGGLLRLSAIARKIQWEEGRASILTANGESYTASKAVITAPLNVLQAGALQFLPALPAQQAAIAQSGMGAVIKILLEFDPLFLETVHERTERDMQFVLSRERVPTWWTQYPSGSPLLTGWLGGPAAQTLQNVPEETLLEMALTSLSNIFNIPVPVVRSLLRRHYVVNWTADPFTRGSYTYPTVHSRQALQTLMQPVAHTLYFAGEACYDGPAIGTVEAALTSGQQVARRILSGA